MSNPNLKKLPNIISFSQEFNVFTVIYLRKLPCFGLWKNHFLFVGLFNLGNAETQTFLVSRNRDGFALAESQTRKSGTITPLFSSVLISLQLTSSSCCLFAFKCGYFTWRTLTKQTGLEEGQMMSLNLIMCPPGWPKGLKTFCHAKSKYAYKFKI